MKTIVAVTCRVLVPLTFLFLVSNCTVNKRHYMKGFHVEWKRKTPLAHNQESRKQRLHNCATTSTAAHALVPEAPAPDLTAAAISGGDLKFSAKKALILTAPPDSCKDEILFRNGDLVKARIEEISSAEVRYRRCDNPDGPLYTTSTSKIFSVTYANGLKRVFEKPVTAAASVTAAPTARRKTNGWAVTSFICALLGILVIPLLFAFIFGIVGYQKIQREPQRYKGKWMAIVGIVMGSAAIVLFLLLMVLLFI